MAPKRIEGWIIHSKWPLTNCKIETYVCVIEKEPCIGTHISRACPDMAICICDRKGAMHCDPHKPGMPGQGRACQTSFIVQYLIKPTLLFVSYHSCNKPSKMITDCPYEVTYPPAKNPNLTKRKRKGKALNKNDSKVNQKEETSLPAIQCMAPLSEQPQLSVSEEYEKAVTDLLEELDMPQPLPPPNTTAVMWCPIHDTVMQFRTSKNGWRYLKCEVHDCWLFASQTEAPPYMEAARHQLHPELKQQFPVLTCDCDYPAKPVLKVSKSIKNPGRMFLNCNNKIKFNFF